VNNIFQLEGTPDIKMKVQSLGQVYVQIKFLEEGMIDDKQQPVCIENLAQKLKEQQGVYSGMLRVFLVNCSGLVKADKGKNEQSDPYVVFKAATIILNLLARFPEASRSTRQP